MAGLTFPHRISLMGTTWLEGAFYIIYLACTCWPLFTRISRTNFGYRRCDHCYQKRLSRGATASLPQGWPFEGCAQRVWGNWALHISTPHPLSSIQEYHGQVYQASQSQTWKELCKWSGPFPRSISLHPIVCSKTFYTKDFAYFRLHAFHFSCCIKLSLNFNPLLFVAFLNAFQLFKHGLARKLVKFDYRISLRKQYP